jgi:Pyridoxamine 5'-phosphate oxidase
VGKLYGEITLDLGTWLKQQPLFFVATSPLADDGFVNCSPKGMDSFRVLGPTQVAYLDLTGSGVETISHLRENGRIVFMFCAFTGLPKIVRLHGTGEVFTPGSPDWSQLREHFPEHLGERAIVSASLTRISDSCGFAVPQLEFVGPRDILTKSHEVKGIAGLQKYRNEKNARSLDGLPGLEPQP